MSIQILKQFKRDSSPLTMPVTMGTGVQVGDDGSVWGWCILPGLATDELNSGVLIRLTHDQQSDLRRITPPGAEFHAKIQWGVHDADDYRAREMTDGLDDGQFNFIEVGARRIEDCQFPERHVIFGVRFDDDAPGQGNLLGKAQKITGTRHVVSDASAALGRAIGRIRSWQNRMAGSHFGARPATSAEIAWALRRDLVRTVDYLPKGEIAGAGEIVRLRSAQVDPHREHVRIQTVNGERFLRMLTPIEGGFPTDELELPGGEWLKHLNICTSAEDGTAVLPVEVSIRGVNLPQKQALRALKDALALVKDQHRGASKGMAGEAPEHVSDAGKAIVARMNEVRRGQVGMIQDSVTWVIEAGDLDELETRTHQVIDFYGGMGIDVWAPPAIQDLLYKELIVGDKRRVEEFSQFRPMGTLVGAWFHGGSAIGAPNGFYLAEIVGSTPGPFYNRLSDAQMEGKRITTVYVGQSGSGKSTGVMLSALGEAVMGAWVALLDLKGDLGGIVKVARRFGVTVTEVNTTDAAAGSLDPFRFMPDINDAVSYAVDHLSACLDVTNSTRVESHLRRAALRVAAYSDPDKRSCHAVIGELQDDTDTDACAIGADLADLAKDPTARPVLGPPDLAAAQLTTDPGLVYMCFRGLRWPGKQTARAQWKPGERLSMMLIQAGFAYAQWMGDRVQGIPKVLALTELHYILAYDFGVGLVGQTALTGRAKDQNMLLDTQEVARLLTVDGLLDQISQVHAFSVGTDDEAEAQARLLGIPFEQRMAEKQKGLAQGVALTRDRWDRIGFVHFDYLTREIEEDLQTKPVRTRKGQPVPAEEIEDLGVAS